MTDATARLSQYYEQAYGHKLKQRLRLQAAIAGYDTPGFSLKGGAVQGMLVYTFRGQQIKGDHPEKRKAVMKTIAHEMAHIWQLSGDHISVDGHAPWVYEGGADAMAMDALLHTGLWTAAQVQAFADQQQATCGKLGDTTGTYDGIYACGYARHLRSGKDVKQVWRTLRERSEREHAPIDAAMFDDAIKQPAVVFQPTAH
nr:basic secretory family protein [Pseudoduganella ginsengisoli]